MKRGTTHSKGGSEQKRRHKTFPEMLKEACLTRNDDEFKRWFQNLKDQILRTPNCILDLDSLGNSTPKIILTSCFFKNLEKVKATQRALSLLNLIFSANIPDFKPLLTERYSSDLLFCAIHSGSVEILKFLLNYLSFPEYLEILKDILMYQTRDKFMLLNTAATSGGSVEMLSLLLDFLSQYPMILETHLTNKIKFGLTPLDSAVKSGSIEMTSLLLKYLSEPKYSQILQKILEYKNQDNFTLLSKSVTSGSVEMVRLVLGALSQYPQILETHLATQTRGGFTPLDSAIKSGSIEVTSLLLKYLSEPKYSQTFQKILTYKTQNKFTLLNIAVKSGSVGMVRLVLGTLSQYPQILETHLVTQNTYGFTPLESAIKSGSIEVTSLLLEYLCKPEYSKILQIILKNKMDDFMLLNTVAVPGCVQMARLVLDTLYKYPAILETHLANRNKYGFTPLESAIMSGSIEVTKLLLEYLSKPEYSHILQEILKYKMKDDFMLLNSVMKSSSVEMVKLVLDTLLDYPEILKTQLVTQAKGGFTPLNSALKSGSVEVTKLLLEYLSKPEYLEILKKLLKHKTQENYSTLYTLITYGKTDAVRYYLMAFSKAFGNKAPTELQKLTRDLNPEKYSKEVDELIRDALAGHFPTLAQKDRGITQNRDPEKKPRPVDTTFSQMLKEACLTRDDDEFKRLFQNLKDQILSTPNCILDLDSSGSPTPENILYFCFFKYPDSDKVKATQKALNLLNLIFSANIHDFKELLNPERYSFPLLHSAVNSGSVEIIKLLLSYLSLPEYSQILQEILNDKMQDGFMLLTCAAKSGSVEMLRLVLDTLSQYPKILETHLATRNKYGFTPLNAAVKSGSIAVTKLLLEYLSNPNYSQIFQEILMYPTQDDFMLLNSVATFACVDMARLVLRTLSKYPKILRVHLANQNKYGFTPLDSAVKSGSVELTTLLLEYLSQPEYSKILQKILMYQTRDKFKLLNTAESSGSVEMLRLVLGTLSQYPKILGAHLDNRTKGDFTPLDSAVKSGSLEKTRLLLKYLSEPKYAQILQNILNYKAAGDFMLLHTAVTSGSAQMVTLILDLLSQYPETLITHLTYPNKYDFTPLDSAVNSGYKEITKLLLEHLSKPEHSHILQEILKYKTKDNFMLLNSVVSDGIKTGSVEMVKLVLDTLSQYPEIFETNLSNQTKGGYTPLDSAIKSGSIEVTTLLLKYLSEPKYSQIFQKILKCKTKDNFMLLNSIVSTGSVEMLTLLLGTLSHYPAILETHLACRNKSGFAPLDSAVKSGSESCVNAILDVLEKHIDILQENLRGDTTKRRSYTILNTALRNIKNLDCLKRIIALHEKYLSQKEWQDVLLTKTKENYSTLDTVTTYGNTDAVKYYLMVFSRAFGNKARTELQKLARYLDTEKYSKEVDGLIRDALAGNFPTSPLSLQKTASIPPLAQKDAIEIPDPAPLISTPLTPVPFSETSNDKTPKTQKKISATNPPVKNSNNALSLPFIFRFKQKNKMVSNTLPPIVTPFAGINDKYLAQEWLKAPYDHGFNTLDAVKNKQHVFVSIENASAASQGNTEVFTLYNPCLEANFYTTRGRITPEQRVSFICAGRKENALMVQPQEGRCVIVLAQTEWKSLTAMQKQAMFTKADVLVLNKIVSPIFGEFQPHFILSRRIGIFLAANYWKLNHFIMLDDNIQHVHFKDETLEVNSWDAFYDVLKKELGREPCVTVSRHFCKQAKPGQMGSKLFMIDLNKIRTKLTDDALFFLFSCGQPQHSWGEDYYFQIMLHQLFAEQAQGFRVVDKDVASLQRAQKHGNAFALSTGKSKRILAKALPPLDLTLSAQIHPLQLARIKATIALLNEIITQNKNRLDLQQAKLNALIQEETINRPPIIDLKPRDFVSQFKKAFGQSDTSVTLRPYQKKALHCLAQFEDRFARITMATGTGKTRVIEEAAYLASQLLQPPECVVILTANISLVTQLTAALRAGEYKDTLRTVAISSAHTTVHRLMNNLDKLQNKKMTFVFCIDSFMHLLNEYPSFLSHVRLMLMDEYHDYVSHAKEIVEKATTHPDLLTLGLTATPPKENFLNPIFNYTHQQGVKEGFLAPVVIDRLKIDPADENISSFSEGLANLLWYGYHPGFADCHADKTTLENTKGIIFLPSIDLCEKVDELLRGFGFTSYAIHSQNPQRESHIKQFKEREQGILLACGMCQLGFDDIRVDYLIIAKKVKNIDKLKQILGRVVRRNKNKIGYVLAFDEVYTELEKILAKQPITLPVDPDFLGQKSCPEIKFPSQLQEAAQPFDPEDPEELQTIFEHCLEDLSFFENEKVDGVPIKYDQLNFTYLYDAIGSEVLDFLKEADATILRENASPEIDNLDKFLSSFSIRKF